MLEKTFLLIAYSVFGAILAAWISLGLRRSFIQEVKGRSRETPSYTDLIRPEALLATGGALVGLLLAWLLPWWWNNQIDFSLGQALAYGSITGVSLLALVSEASRSDVPLRSPTMRVLVGAIALGLAGIVCFSTGILHDPTIQSTLWHHWVAYLGPAELLRAGGRIFYDFPAQYGLGPTLLLAAACEKDCWTGMYFVTGLASLLYVVLLLVIVLQSNFKSFTGFSTAVATVVVAAIFWLAYPPQVSSPIVTPSTGGLRFLPPLMLTTALILSEHSNTIRRYWRWIGSVFFIIGIFWSPEALFLASLIWGPYYVSRSLDESTDTSRVRAFLRSACVPISTLAISFILAVAAYRTIYGVFPDARAYLAYILYPPGPMPINPTGPVWFWLATLALGLLAAFGVPTRQTQTSTTRSRSLIVLLLYGSLTYALGRSHDNNFLNLMPFMAVALLWAFRSRLPLALRMVAAGMIASSLGLSGIFGWGVWAQSINGNHLFEFAPIRLSRELSYEYPVTAERWASLCKLQFCNPADAARAIKHVRSISQDPITVFDYLFTVLPTQPWNAMTSPSTYVFIPSEWRRQYLANTADRLKQSGWLIIHKSTPSIWLEDFKAVYDVTSSLDFGSYQALHLEYRQKS